MNKSYSEVILLPTFKERFEYLSLNGKVANETFGFDRYLNQILYKTKEWLDSRYSVIIRDDGCDLAMSDYPISGKILVHHINPITIEDILERRPIVFDPQNLICVSHATHTAIHYGNDSLLPKDPIERQPNDTCPWR